MNTKHVLTALSRTMAHNPRGNAAGAPGSLPRPRKATTPTNRRPHRRHPRSGITLVELMVACSLLAIIAVIGSRLVFLTDRTIRREKTRSTGNAYVLQLAANLRRDISQAARVQLTRKPAVLTLKTAEGTTITYENNERGVLCKGGHRLQRTQPKLYEDLGMARPPPDRIFPGLSIEFSGTESDLVRVGIKMGGELRMSLVVHPRNAPVEPEARAGESR